MVGSLAVDVTSCCQTSKPPAGLPEIVTSKLPPQKKLLENSPVMKASKLKQTDNSTQSHIYIYKYIYRIFTIYPSN